MSKYFARKFECLHGHKHDSKGEAARCNALHVLQRAGAITDLQVQHKLIFIVDGKPLKLKNGQNAGAKVDFFYSEMPSMKDVIEEFKGFVVRDWPLRRALIKHCFPMIEYREVKA